MKVWKRDVWLAPIAIMATLAACSAPSPTRANRDVGPLPSGSSPVVAASESPSPSSSPSPGSSPNPAASPSPAASPNPSTSPGPLSSCPYGKGSIDTSYERTVPSFLSEVDNAINQLSQTRPELFDLNSAVGEGGFRVLDPQEYHAAVVRSLAATGLCAEFNGEVLKVKNSNEFSDHYDILLSSGYVRRGNGSYRGTQRPADFPIDSADYIDDVRVAFFGFRCPEGITPPRNGLGELPVGCTGFVTATPKDKNNKDVPSWVHGPLVAWTLDQPIKSIRLDHFEDQPFNQAAVGLEEGTFTLCAKVLGKEGCLYGRVTSGN